MGLAGQQLQEFCCVRTLVDPSAIEAVAIATEQDLGFELAQARGGTLRRVVLSAARPDRSQGGGRQEGHHGIGNIRQIGAHPVAGAHPQAPQFGSHRPDAPRQFRPVDLRSGAVLVDADDGRSVTITVPQHLIDIVQSHAGKPACGGHGRISQHARVAVEGADCGPDIEELPERPPESSRIVHRPLPERRVVGCGGPMVGRRRCGEPAPLRFPAVRCGHDVSQMNSTPDILIWSPSRSRVMTTRQTRGCC